MKNHEDDVAAKIGHFFLKPEREKFILSLPEIRIRSCTFKVETLRKEAHMKRHSILLFFITLVFLVFFLCDISFALEVMVSPHEVFPGDAFVIKVTNTRVSKMSPASFMGKNFYSSRSEERCFIAIGAVEMKTQPGVYPVNLKIGKRRKRMDIVVKHISFPTREITLPEDEVLLSTENLRRVKKEERRKKTEIYISESI